MLYKCPNCDNVVDIFGDIKGFSMVCSCGTKVKLDIPTKKLIIIKDDVAIAPINIAEEIKKSLDKIIWKKPKPNEFIGLKPIKIIEMNNDIFTNDLYLFGEHIGIVIDNKMCVNKQKVLDLVHNIELFEKIVKDYEELHVKIMEIEYS